MTYVYAEVWGRKYRWCAPRKLLETQDAFGAWFTSAYTGDVASGKVTRTIASDIPCAEALITAFPVYDISAEAL